MVPRTILAINYQNRTKTEIGFQGSPLMPLGKGHAVVESKNGRISVDADFRAIGPANKFGPEYLTYVLWAITPEGRANNLGELLLSGEKSKLQATTTLQTFGLIVTAEPYYAVAEPSDVVVLENVFDAATTGTLQQVNAELSTLQALVPCAAATYCTGFVYGDRKVSHAPRSAGGSKRGGHR